MGACACLLPARANAALEALVGAARGGCEGAGGQFRLLRPGPGAVEALLGADALLLAVPALPGGMPGEAKGVFDELLERIPRGDVTPRTARMHAGYVSVAVPDDADLLDLLHRQALGLFSFLGMTYRGRAFGASAEAVARRLGAVLARGEGFAGYPEEYLAGIARFNDAEFWEAHEDWEEVWLREEGELRLFYQGLIQVSAAFHHHRRENWKGMAALFREGRAKLERFLPRAMGLDLEEFLGQVEPWRLLAEARLGRGSPVTRIPQAYPRIAVDPVPPDVAAGG